VYRPAWTRDQALELLRAESGVAFDPRCVTALETVLDGRAVPAGRATSPAFVAQTVS
jgi:HD-GYP domain-containing protein (c-di-GMP phosphodiesterase class II)